MLRTPPPASLTHLRIRPGFVWYSFAKSSEDLPASYNDLMCVFNAAVHLLDRFAGRSFPPARRMLRLMAFGCVEYSRAKATVDWPASYRIRSIASSCADWRSRNRAPSARCTEVGPREAAKAVPRRSNGERSRIARSSSSMFICSARHLGELAIVGRAGTRRQAASCTTVFR